MEAVELLKRGYRALGLGADRDVLAMFGQGREGPEPRWVVVDLTGAGRPWPSRRIVAHDLFGGLPPQWELVGVDVDRWLVKAERVVVSGHYRARPAAARQRWEVVRVPFAHIWTLSGGRAERVVSYLDGVELRRSPAAA
jgi:hypothetical protein